MKTFIHLFIFGRHEGKLETFAKICVTASLETLHAVCVRDKQADWKLLSEISRTAPAQIYVSDSLWAVQRYIWTPLKSGPRTTFVWTSLKYFIPLLKAISITLHISLAGAADPSLK